MFYTCLRFHSWIMSCSNFKTFSFWIFIKIINVVRRIESIIWWQLISRSNNFPRRIRSRYTLLADTEFVTSPLQDDSSLYSSGHKIVSFTARSHFGFHVLLDDYYPNSFDPPAELGDRIKILTSQSADWIVDSQAIDSRLHTNLFMSF